MGAKWEVSQWVKHDEGGYYYEQVYFDHSFWRAIHAAIKAKRAGAGCVKVEWR